MPKLRLWCCAALAASCLVLTASTAWTDDAKKKADAPPAEDNKSYDLDAGLSRAILAVGHDKGKLAAERATKRDDAQVYAKVAPAVVLLRNHLGGSGTGFFISADGWIVTNHHVAEHADFNAKTGERELIVNVGKLVKGDMELDEAPLVAKVYKWDPKRDLALLKLTRLPKGRDEVPYLKVARTAPRTTTPVYLIGHTAVGTLWSFRDGKITGTAHYPGGIVKDLVPVLHKAGMDKGKLTAMLQNQKRLRMLASNCGTTPGDSGSPVVNKAGEVIAVHFAGTGMTQGSNRISYHIHLSEVQDFLDYFDLKADRPRAPLFLPSSLPPFAFYTLAEPADEKVAYTIAFTGNQGSGVGLTGRWFNLRRKIDVPAGATAAQKASKFNPDLAILYPPGMIVCFYDTQGKGWDLILLRSERDGKPINLDSPPDRVLIRTSDGNQPSGWRMGDAGKYKHIVEPSLFKDKDCQGRLSTWLRSLGKKP